MDRSRLKNVIILILALVNVFLLGSIVWRLAMEQAANRRTAAELTELCLRQGVSLEARLPDALPPAAHTLARDVNGDALLAGALLGEALTASDLGGGIYSYVNDSGQGTFRASGGFEITGLLAKKDPEAVCRKFCQAFGYQDFSMSLAGGSGTGTAIQRFEGFPVINAAVTFLVEDGQLISVRGVHLPQTILSSDTSASMTAVTAVTRFLDELRSGAVVSSILDLSLCYELQSTAAAPMALIPVWQITTDIGNYYVNCLSGAVSHS